MAAYLDALSAHGQAERHVLVTQGPDVVYGRLRLRRSPEGVPNTAQTEFRLSSVSKQFTRDGRPDSPDPSPAQRVRPLLPLPARLSQPVAAGHDRRTPHPPSGIGDTSTIWAPPGRPARRRPRGSSPASATAAALRTRYPHAVQQLRIRAARRADRADLRPPLARLLQQNIFRPLGMTTTGTDTTMIRPGHAHGYYADGQQPLAYPMSAFFADGGLYSTVADMRDGTTPSSTAR